MPPLLHQVQQVLTRPPKRIELPQFRRASVATILTPQAEMLFIRRAEYPGDPWSGHVSFPGGRVEPDDPSPLHAAIRETEEEIGLTLSTEQLLGELDEVSTLNPLPSILIRPHVFVAEVDLDRLALNDEVASVHRIPLSDLLDNRGRGTMEHPWRGTDLRFPRVDFDGVRLWGLTLFMVDDLLHRLDEGGRGMLRLPPELRGDGPTWGG
jgi:8-oxo-dGTP pyrophosphatase MutT (NUDIX family)